MSLQTYHLCIRTVRTVAAVSTTLAPDRERDRKLASLAAWAAAKYGVPVDDVAKVVVRGWSEIEETLIEIARVTPIVQTLNGRDVPNALPDQVRLDRAGQLAPRRSGGAYPPDRRRQRRSA